MLRNNIKKRYRGTCKFLGLCLVCRAFSIPVKAYAPLPANCHLATWFPPAVSILLWHHSFYLFLFSIRPPPELLPVLGPLEWYMTSTLDAALLYSSRAGSDLGQTLELCQLGFLIPKYCGSSNDMVY